VLSFNYLAFKCMQSNSEIMPFVSSYGMMQGGVTSYSFCCIIFCCSGLGLAVCDMFKLSRNTLIGLDKLRSRVTML
jgi:hypothetical protein